MVRRELVQARRVGRSLRSTRSKAGYHVLAYGPLPGCVRQLHHNLLGVCDCVWVARNATVADTEKGGDTCSVGQEPRFDRAHRDTKAHGIGWLGEPGAQRRRSTPGIGVKIDKYRPRRKPSSLVESGKTLEKLLFTSLPIDGPHGGAMLIDQASQHRLVGNPLDRTLDNNSCRHRLGAAKQRDLASVLRTGSRGDDFRERDAAIEQDTNFSVFARQPDCRSFVAWLQHQYFV